MIRMASLIGLNAEKKEEYEELHRQVWPSVLEMISRCHIRNYSIFLREPENILFGYFEYHGDNFEADMAQMAQDEETKRWWALTDPCQVPLSTKEDAQWWAPMREVFHAD